LTAGLEGVRCWRGSTVAWDVNFPGNKNAFISLATKIFQFPWKQKIISLATKKYFTSHGNKNTLTMKKNFNFPDNKKNFNFPEKKL
jgi:hypothetical protein